MLFKDIGRKFINLLFPHRCFVCERIIDGVGFCEECIREKIQFIRQPTCSLCGNNLDIKTSVKLSETNYICADCSKNGHIFDKAVSVFVYNEYFAKVVILFKFKNKFFLSKFFFKYLKKKINEFNDAIDFIIPVPMHVKKLRLRGYNQAVLLVKEFEKDGYKNVIYDLLKKTVNGKPQMSLKYRERRLNLRNSFKINENYIEKIRDKNVLIIDDIFTTGSTVDECSKILKQNGVKKVFVLTIAKTSARSNTKKYETYTFAEGF
jgi:ComF family protein